MRTFIFVPAHDERKVTKALASAADAVILDLEDAIPEDKKTTAREAAAKIVREHAAPGPRLWVRVNASDTPHYDADLAAIDWRGAGVMVAKAEDSDGIRRLANHELSGLVLLLESARGFAQVDALVAAAPVVPRLAIGTWDLLRDLGLPVEDPDASELIWHLRAEMVVASRTLRLELPVDGVYGRFDDAAGFEAAAKRAYHLGFGGKLLIHPAQIPLADAVFGVSEARLAEARELVAAYEQAERTGAGAISFKGQLVDRVHADRARALLQARRQVTPSA